MVIAGRLKQSVDLRPPTQDIHCYPESKCLAGSLLSAGDFIHSKKAFTNKLHMPQSGFIVIWKN